MDYDGSIAIVFYDHQMDQGGLDVTVTYNLSVKSLIKSLLTFIGTERQYIKIPSNDEGNAISHSMTDNVQSCTSNVVSFVNDTKLV